MKKKISFFIFFCRNQNSQRGHLIIAFQQQQKIYIILIYVRTGRQVGDREKIS